MWGFDHSFKSLPCISQRWVALLPPKMALRPQAKWSSSHPKAAPAGRVEMEIEEISSEEGAAEAPHRIGSNSLRLTPEQQSLVLGYDWDPPYLSGPNQWQGSLPLRHNQRGCQYCLLCDKVCTEGHIMSASHNRAMEAAVAVETTNPHRTHFHYWNCSKPSARRFSKPS